MLLKRKLKSKILNFFYYIEAHFKCFINTLLLNYKSADMDGYLAPTDSRFRNDMRLFEEGKLDEADQEKIRLEVK